MRSVRSSQTSPAQTRGFSFSVEPALLCQFCKGWISYKTPPMTSNPIYEGVSQKICHTCLNITCLMITCSPQKVFQNVQEVCGLAFIAMLTTMLASTVRGRLCGPAASVNVQFLGLRPQHPPPAKSAPKRARQVSHVYASNELDSSNSRISDVVRLPRREVYSVLGSVSQFSLQYLLDPSMLGTVLIATPLPYLMGGSFHMTL